MHVRLTGMCPLHQTGVLKARIRQFFFFKLGPRLINQDFTLQSDHTNFFFPICTFNYRHQLLPLFPSSSCGSLHCISFMLHVFCCVQHHSQCGMYEYCHTFSGVLWNKHISPDNSVFTVTILNKQKIIDFAQGGLNCA